MLVAKIMQTLGIIALFEDLKICVLYNLTMQCRIG